jgi:molybdopterin-guanine dinucleotide biosynthesis protein A
MRTPRPDILAVILAGGLGRRMAGAAKPLLPLRGEALVARVARFARGQCVEVALNLYEDDPETRVPFALLGLPFIADSFPGRAGPLAGVLAGLEYAARRPGVTHVLSLPCDTPFPPVDLVARLSAAAGAGLACAASAGREHSAVALWPVGLAAPLRAALAEGMRAVRPFQRAHDLKVVDWPTESCDPFFNINTPEDLALAEALPDIKA